MSSSLEIPFTNSDNYTLSDSNKLEITGGVLRLKDQRPTGYQLYDGFDDADDANWGIGTLARSYTGGASVSGGELDCSGGGLGVYATLDADNTPSVGNQFTLMVAFKPDFTDVPANLCYLLYYNATPNNTIQLYMSTSGGVTCRIKDNAGSYAINRTFAKPSGGWVQDQEYRLFIFFKSGDSRCYLDEVSQWTDTNTFTRDVQASDMLIGGTASSYGHFYITDFFIGTEVDYDYTATYPTTIYATDNPYADCLTASFKASEFLTFTSSETVTGSDVIKITPKANNQFRYISGGTGTNGDGSYAQSNLVSEANADADEYLSARSQINTIRVFVHSEDGTTQPSISTLTVTYDSVLSDPTITTVEIEGFIYSGSAALANKLIKIRPYDEAWAYEGVFNSRDWKTIATTDSDGWFEADIQINPSSKYWEIKIKDSYIMDLSGQTGTVDLSDLTLTKIEDE